MIARDRRHRRDRKPLVDLESSGADPSLAHHIPSNFKIDDARLGMAHRAGWDADEDYRVKELRRKP